jgi:hypothetical protein
MSEQSAREALEKFKEEDPEGYAALVHELADVVEDLCEALTEEE